MGRAELIQSILDLEIVIPNGVGLADGASMARRQIIEHLEAL